MKQLSQLNKLILIIPTLFLSGCGKKLSIPSNVMKYFEKFNYYDAFDYVKNGHFIETYEEVNSENKVYSSHIITCDFLKESQFNFSIVAIYSYSGDQSLENKDKKIEINCSDSGATLLITDLSSDEVDTESISLDQASDYYNRIFYLTWTGYPYGGLYYGDYFINQYRQISDYVKIDEENENIGFEYLDIDRGNNILASQKMWINKQGLLVYNESVIKNASTNACGTLIQEASYNLLN